MGYEEDKVYDVVQVMDDIYDINYSVKNCVKDRTYKQLGEELKRLAQRLMDAAEQLQYEKDEEGEE